MKSRPIVFLGPSLARDAARTILEADFRPPLRTGDLDYFSASDTILIVDGEFGSTTALSPAEVQRAADRGVTFLGAASTGAMLAAQLPRPDIRSRMGLRCFPRWAHPILRRHSDPVPTGHVGAAHLSGRHRVAMA